MKSWTYGYSFRFTVIFITELLFDQIIEWRFGALFEISDRFSSKLDVLATWFN